MQLKLQFLCCLISYTPVFISVLEEFVSTSTIVHYQDTIFIWLVSMRKTSQLRLGFEIGSFVLEGVVSTHVSVEEKVLSDELEELLVFGFEVLVGLVFFVWEGERSV